MSSGHERQYVTDDSSERKYFHMMLNMADDDLDPFTYRLLGHYLRRCGKEGYCDEGVRTTVEITRMSAEKVRTAREELAKLGYIRQDKPSPEQARKGQTIYITIVDRWAENIARYTQAPVPNSAQQANQGVPDLTHPVSDLAQAVSKAAQAVPNSAQAEAQPVPNSAHKKKEKKAEPQEKTELQNSSRPNADAAPAGSPASNSFSSKEKTSTASTPEPSAQPPTSPTIPPTPLPPAATGGAPLGWVQRGAPTVDEAIIGLSHAEIGVRRKTIEALVQCHTENETILLALLPLEHDPDWRVRANLVLVLTRHGDLRGKRVVERLETDPESQVRRAAHHHLLNWVTPAQREAVLNRQIGAKR